MPSLPLALRLRHAAVAVATIAILTAGALTPLQAPTSHLPNLGTPVPGKHATPAPTRKRAESSDSVQATQGSVSAVSDTVVTTPTSTSTKTVHTEVLGGGPSAYVAGGWQPVGPDGIRVAAADPNAADARSTKSVLPVGQVTAAVLSPEETKKYGLSGIVIKVSRADGFTTLAPVAVSIPTSLLNGLYGADYASRLRWVQMPVPADSSSKSIRTAKSESTPVATTSSTVASSKALVATPQASKSSTMLVAMSTPVSSSGTGSFSATSLTPSTSWQVSAQSGDFVWSYPMRTPPAAAGPTPSLALSYDSQSVDGETGSTNNQPSAVGEGWSTSGGGFIERSYVSCSQDDGSSGAVSSSGDLCWKTDNATISFAGHSGTLIKDSTSGVWKLQSDDASRIEHLVGSSQGCGASNGTYDDDCWRVTTTDGTQYYFGMNQLPGWASGNATTNSAWTVPVYGNDSGEPCHGTTFAASSCTQAWRWNLDYVVDVHSNAEALYYDAETNKYAQNGAGATSYIRGGQLDHIDYGMTSSSIYASNAASDKVLYGYDPYGRCSDTSHANCTTETITSPAVAAANPSYYPDVPFDQFCNSSSCTNQLSPTFWTTAMLSAVTTQALISGAYANVDSWALSHSFPSPGDGTNAALWLTQVVHTGYSGSNSLSEPATTFSGITLQNRVWVKDALAPLDKWRISSVGLSTGATIAVNYSAQQCTPSNAASIEANPQSNTNRCFPQWWSPQVTPPVAPQQDLFHKYVVTSVVSTPVTGGAQDATRETDYVYTGTPAWRYDTSPLIPNANRTWSVYAGYNSVEVRVGDHNTTATQQTTDYNFYQGMDGDRAGTSGGTKTVYVTGSSTLKDSLWFAGQTRETVVHNGVGGATLSDTVNTPWASSAATANNGTNSAYLTGIGDSLATAPVSTGGSRTVDTTTTFDNTYGLPQTVNVATSDAGSTCTTNTYTPSNTTAWLIGLPKEIAKVGVACSAVGSAPYPASAISDTRITYDSLALGATPSKGDATKNEVVDSYTGTTASTAHWTTASQTGYDSLGRVTSLTDILGHTSTTSYTPAAGAVSGSGALTSQTVTNTAPFNWTTTTAFNPAWGVETSVTDPNNNVTTATYDALGRRVGVWLPERPQASNTQPSVGYSYLESTTVANAVTTATVMGSNIVTTYNLYDGLGQLVQTQGLAEGGGAVVADTGYDAAGNTVLQNNPYSTTSNPSTTLFVPSSESVIPSETVTTFDGSGRTQASILYSLGTERHRTSYAYPGVDRVDATPPAGGTPTSTFTNSLGQTKKLIQYLATTPLSTATQEATSYGYDNQGNMTSMTDPAGNAWSWKFDVLGHQTTAVDPDTGTTITSYDNAGNVLTTTDARSNVLAYSYDNLNRKTAEYLGAVGSSGKELASWVYDTVAKGQLTSSSSYTGSTVGTPGIAYTEAVTAYDTGYRPTGSTISIPTGAPAFGGTSYSTSYSYLQGGQLNTQVDPAEGGIPAETLRYGYDGTARLSGLRGAVQFVTTVYNAIGQLAEFNRPGATAMYSDFGHDQATGAITEDVDSTLVGTTSTTIADRIYTRNEAGDVTSIATSAASVATDTQCFGYDYLQELTSAWTPTSGNCSTTPTSTTIGGPAPYWTSYTINPANGNRTQSIQNAITSGGTSTTNTYSYPAAGSARPHAVQSVAHSGGNTGTDSYSYDASGNTKTRPGQTLTYDATGRLATVITGATTQSSVYDASGQLLLQSDGTSGSTLFLGDTEIHLNAGSSTPSAVRTYTAAGIPVAERASSPGVSGTILQWLGTDPQNTASDEVVVSTGSVTRRYTDPYGNSRGAATTWSSTHSFLNATVSAISGLTQLGARAYDAALGKFLSVDSVLAPQTPAQNNGYSYARNDPASTSDPSGLAAPADWVGFDGPNQPAWVAAERGPTAPGNSVPTERAHTPGRLPTLFDKMLYWLEGVNEDSDGILRTRAHPAQVYGDYNDSFDWAFQAARTGAQPHKYPFQYRGNSYVVWMWKGEYLQWGYGAEVGFYEQGGPLKKAGPLWWANPSDPNLPTMSESVSYNHSEIASFAPQSPQSWVGTWNQNVGSWNPITPDAQVNNLQATATLNFPNADILKAFANSQYVRQSTVQWTFNMQAKTATVNY